MEEGLYTGSKLSQGTRMVNFGEGEKLFIDISEGVTVTTTKNTTKNTMVEQTVKYGKEFVQEHKIKLSAFRDRTI